MPEIRWSRSAERAIARLPVIARAEAMNTITSLRLMPELGQVVEEGRYAGCRRLPIKP